MQQFVRRLLTAFVFSTLAFLGLGFGANALTVTPVFTVSPNPINAGQSSTLDLLVGAGSLTGFPETVPIFDKLSSSITLFSGIGDIVTVFGNDLPTITLPGGPAIQAHATFSYPNPGIFPANYSFVMAGIVSCVGGVCADPVTVIDSGFINLVVNPVPQVPLPAALPLFATGLGALGLLAWRRKRKQAA